MKNRNRFLLLISFISGMSIMAMEISAARLIAPYFGTSIFVWTNVIGIVLVALSFGYYVGGKYADRRPNLNAVLYPMLASGLIFLVVPWIVKPLASVVAISVGLSSSAVIVFVGSFILTLLLFAFPIMLLGMVSPFIIKLYDVTDQHIGEMAGSVFAVSTLGSIIGTFLPTLWFIPTIGTRATITVFASLLILLAIFGIERKRFKGLALPALLLPIVAWPGSSALPDVIYEEESVYQFISIDEDESGSRFLRFNEGVGIQSIYHPNSVKTGHYYDRFADLPEHFENDDLDIAIIGLAGGSISRQLPEESRIVGVEIDSKVIEAATEYFELQRPNLHVVQDDGRMFVAKEEDAFDIMIIDAYAQQLYIQWTMTTKEFWADVESSLKEDGLVAININASSDEAPLLVALQNTMAAVFENVYVEKAKEDSWNYMVTATNTRLDIDVEPISFDANEMILTDDRAPVEFMTDKMIFDSFFGM